MKDHDKKPEGLKPADDPEPRAPPRSAKEILRVWEAEGMPKNSLYWRLRQLEAEGK